MDVTTALRNLGVHDGVLTDDERRRLDEDGYLAIPNVLSPTQLGTIRARLDAILAEEGEDAGKEVHQEAGTERMADLVNKGSEFDIFYTHPKVLPPSPTSSKATSSSPP